MKYLKKYKENQDNEEIIKDLEKFRDEQHTEGDELKGQIDTAVDKEIDKLKDSGDSGIVKEIENISLDGSFENITRILKDFKRDVLEDDYRSNKFIEEAWSRKIKAFYKKFEDQISTYES